MANRERPKNIRHEFKYIVSDRLATVIMRYAMAIGLRLSAVQDGCYTITSLYFDTPALTDYYEKSGGFNYRKKLRARIYNRRFDDPSGSVWIEMKEKHDMNICKERTEIAHEEWEAFIDSGCPAKSGLVHRGGCLRKFCHRFMLGRYVPHIVVRYERVVYEAVFLSNIRMTFDSRIETCTWRDFVNNGDTIPVQKGKTILEIKFRHALPWWFGDMVRRFGLSRSTFSKYANAVDAVNRHNPISR